jgi:hypothetical protein
MNDQHSNYDNESEIRKVDDYRNEHGQPSFEYLQSLVDEGDEDAMEKIKSIAEDLNVAYDTDAPAAELVEMIRLTSERNQEGGLDATT